MAVDLGTAVWRWSWPPAEGNGCVMNGIKEDLFHSVCLMREYLCLR